MLPQHALFAGLTARFARLSLRVLAVFTAAAGATMAAYALGHAQPELNSGIIPPGGVFEHTFTAVGLYPYYCQVHAYPPARVTVTADASAPSDSVAIVNASICGFNRSCVTIRLGGTVRWRNSDLVAHTVTSNGSTTTAPGGTECCPAVGSGSPLNQQFTMPPMPPPAPTSGCCPCWSVVAPTCPPGSRAVPSTAPGAPSGAWSCRCWRYFDPPYVSRFDYELSAESVAGGIRFGGILVPSGFGGIDVFTDAGDTLRNLEAGKEYDLGLDIARFTVTNIPLLLDAATFQGDEFPLGIRFVPETLQVSFSVSGHANTVDVGEPGSRQWTATFLGPSPNPAARTISFGVQTAQAGALRVRILDISGRLVRSVFVGGVEIGRHSFEWDLRRDDGQRAAPGVYLIAVDGVVRFENRKVAVR